MKKQIIFFLSALSGFFIGVFITGKVENKARKKIQIISDKHLALFLMMNRWVQAKQEGKNVSDFLEHNAYKNIAIYGMSYAGERLFEQLSKSNIKVKYGIDRKSNCNCGNLKIDHIYSTVCCMYLTASQGSFIIAMHITPFLQEKNSGYICI